MKCAHFFFALVLSGSIAPFASAQDAIPTNPYLRMASGEKALASMRFDLASYRDTLRAYKSDLEEAITSISAISQAEQDHRARLGLLRDDLNALDKELRRARRPLKHADPATLAVPAENTARLIDQVRALRDRLHAARVVLH